jgi:crotonobetainyl-CoA:carnitine CoA-transferase CaiB-like acyl-CoA transferase
MTPRFQNIFSMEAGMEFDAIWYSWLADHSKQELFEIFLKSKIASAPVNSPGDLGRDNLKHSALLAS